MTFGQRIRALRKDLGLTQRELAERVGIDFTYLSKIENDRGEPPSEGVIKKLAARLSADPDELTVLAGKVPSDLAPALDLEQIKHLRKLMSGHGTRRSGGKR